MRRGLLGQILFLQWLARKAKVRGPRAMSSGGLDRYAASKICAIYFAAALSEDSEFSETRAYCIDPGLMPGNGLARQHTVLVRFVWKRV